MNPTIEQFLSHINKRVNLLELEIQKLQQQRRALSEARVINIASIRRAESSEKFRKAA